MIPVNSKSLLAFIFGTMEKLEKKEITVSEAKEQANLTKQANNILSYELQRSKTLMELAKHNAIYKDGLNLRNIESKNFD